MTRYDIARGHNRIYFSTDPLDDFEAPSVVPLNATTGEQWEFDGVSENGMEAFMFGFYRDPSFSIFGTGNLRFYLEIAFANGSRHAAVEYAEESIVQSCPGQGTRGIWRGDNWSFGFEISADMSRAEITMDSPIEKGHIVMTSIAPARYADSTVWPSRDASSVAVPYFHWVEPIPVAEVSINATVLGERISWTGMGGHERLWGAYNWFTCIAGMTAVRIRAGPFALSLVQFESNIPKGLVVSSVMLTKDGKKILSTRRDEPSDQDDYILFRELYEGPGITTQLLANKATGFKLHLLSPSRNASWTFIVTHLNIGFEYPFAGGFGSTGYSGIVEGGEARDKWWKGPAFSEIMEFPKKSMLFSSNSVA
ncbi:hypothetical protein E0Z10_g10658 [Xylaria hypoxylon]|uniref:Beta-xylosidase C-terminal Concanavalin A-like domain-containing protein n=1 Tax=Xylaria hypoxylon TaxID=37992 RepID=A0A4Z0Y301_9PEZI|nr:hypothetical protein E0Z10_g10658 [Xylaria hypoxylon]